MQSTPKHLDGPFSRIDYLDPTNPSEEEILIQSGLLDLVRLRLARLEHNRTYTVLLERALAALGETPERIKAVSTWRESTLFNRRERAALCLAEALTGESQGPVSPEVIREARRHFNDAEMIQLVLSIFSSSDWYHHPEGG